MQSLENKLIESGYSIVNPKLFNEISKMENLYYGALNKNEDLFEERENLRFEIESLKKDDQKCLVDISKKLSTTLKSLGEDEMLKELMLQRAKILDHFTLSYLAEMELKPSQIKLIQSVNVNGEIEMYFEKHSNIIL